MKPNNEHGVHSRTRSCECADVAAVLMGTKVCGDAERVEISPSSTPNRRTERRPSNTFMAFPSAFSSAHFVAANQMAVPFCPNAITNIAAGSHNRNAFTEADAGAGSRQSKLS